MPWVRSCMLVTLVASILVGFSFVNRPEDSMVERLLQARAHVAEALQLPTPPPADAPIPAPTATPTDTPAVPPADPLVPVATATDVAPPVVGVDTPVALATDTPTTTPAATDTSTPTSLATLTPTPTATSTAATSPSATPTVDASLPPLAPRADVVGTVAESLLGVDGGRIATADGRVVIDVPAGAVPEDVAFMITKGSLVDAGNPRPELPIVGRWDFDATAQAGAVSVHTFLKDLNVTIRFSPGQLAGHDPESLQLWRFDDVAQQWDRIPSKVNWLNRTLTAPVGHFSQYAATANKMVDLAPLLDGRNTNLHSGSAALSVPIVAPPGRGGLVPDLSLTYDSGRVGEMKDDFALGSWVGIGWDLTTGSINISESPDEDGNGNPDEPYSRYFMNAGGFGGELLAEDASPGAGTWHLRDEQYVKITTACSDFSCPWYATDKSGRKYTFGADEQYKRWYCEFPNPNSHCNRKYYQLDLSSIEDVLGNRIDFVYWRQLTQVCGDTHCADYVESAYPSTVTYNGGLAQVAFNRGSTATPAYRVDAPYDSWVCGHPIYASKVVETSWLDSIDVNVKVGANWKRARKYAFTYQTTDFDRDVNNCHDTWRPKAGQHTLTSISLRDTADASSLYTMIPTYTSKHFAFWESGHENGFNTFDRPHLTQATNGFGGTVQFTYAEKGNTSLAKYWTREVVTEERHIAGAGQPDVVTTFAYGAGPDQYDYPSPYDHMTADPFKSLYRGFSEVTETDASANMVVHKYYTTGTWNDEVRTGREYETTTKDSGGAQWAKTTTTWSIRNIPGSSEDYYNYCWPAGPNCWWDSSKFYTNFVYPSQTDTYLRDNTHLITKNTYDSNANCASTACYGLLTQVDDLGDVDGSGVSRGARVITNTPYNMNTTAWVFTPQYEERVDPANGNALLSSTSYYYDGENSRTPATAPSKGLLTATSTKLNATDYSSRFFTYDTYGNRIRESVPTATRPESQTPGPPIGSIQVFARAARMGPDGANNVRLFIRSGGVDAQSSAKTLSGSWSYVSETWTTDPATGAPWTPAAVDALEAGVRNAMGPNGSGAVAVTQVYAVVTGDGQVLRPTGNGSYLEWGELWGSGTTHWDRVAEESPDDGGSYIKDNTWNGSERDAFQLSDGIFTPNGRIPAGVPYSQTAYDATYHNFPLTVTNPLGQMTTYEYTDATNGDYVFGKPTKVTEPTDHFTQVQYDSFGRTTNAWDNLDSSTYPTISIQYVWGAVPNKTIVNRRTASGLANNVHKTYSCMDGFGREVQHTEQYNAGQSNKVRTNYNGRGLPAQVSQALWYSNAASCPAAYGAITSLDRTAYAYDPLGGVTSATSLAANQTVGPRTTTMSNGNTTTTFDENFHRTVRTRDIGAKKLTVTEPLQSVTLRPSGQGTYYEWTASPPTSPSTAHYLNLAETSADDDATQISQNVTAKDTHAYAGAGLPGGTTVASVVLHFRWKHNDATVTSPTADMAPIFRQNGVDTSGPSYRRTNDDGWGDDVWDMPLNPRTGLAWTLAEVNAGTEFGFQVSAATGAHPYVSQAWIEVVTQTAASASTVYRNDLLGRLTSITDAAGNVTTTAYDLGGRKVVMNDPDMGYWTYGYNAAGSLTAQTDARGITTTLTYDTAERITGKTYSSLGSPVTFMYDSYPDTSFCSTQSANSAKGFLTRMTDGAGQELTCYDIRGRGEKTRRNIDGTDYPTSQTFDDLDQLATMTYPDNEVVTYNRSLQGNLTSMTAGGQTLISNTVITPWHGIGSLTLGSGQVTNYTYDYRQRLTNIQTGGAQNLTLTYDDASNVIATNDATSSENVSYSYDRLDRLTGMSINTTAAASYSYNQVGNLTSKVESAAGMSNPTNISQYTYPAAGQPRPHAVAATAGTPALTMTYDANGNLATQGASTYAYDAENRLRTRDVASGGYAYTYDGNGTLLKRTSLGTTQTTTLRPNPQGYYSQWTASPNVPHYQNVDETVADETTYIEHATAGLNDTHVYPSANVPAGAVIDKVTLKYRWRGMGVIGALYPMYRQGGVDNIPLAGAAHWPSDGWVTDSWQLVANPVTGQYWTAADVNTGMEFGFRTYWDGWTPRVTQAWVEVTYRTPTDSTVYVGGVYEKKADGSVTKYYTALGKTIAMRSSSVAACTSTPCYLLTDHLGSASTITDSVGTVVSSQKYWPFGATRSGGITQTDKLYTGQQQEPGDSALGLYNYKARFYSTTLGRFVSADTSTGDGLNRYGYTRNNPLGYNDPTGHGRVGIPGPGCVEDTPGDGSCDPPAPPIDPLAWANTVPAPSPLVPGPDSCPTVDEASSSSGDAAIAGVGAVVIGAAVASPLPVVDESAAVVVVGGIYCYQTNCGGRLYDATHDLVKKGLGTLFGKGTHPDDFVPSADVRRPTPEELGRIRHEGLGRLKEGRSGFPREKGGEGDNPDIRINRKTGEIVVPRPGGGFTGTGSYIDEY